MQTTLASFPSPWHRYDIQRQLGQNHRAGRVTFLARSRELDHLVVIKTFQFAQGHLTWADTERYQREISILRRLDHPRIPKYVEHFETDTGFHLVQEYKPAKNLADSGSLSPQVIKKVAEQLLEILLYLQDLTPFIIHGDIKPENILLERHNDDEIRVFLVGFDLSRPGSEPPSTDSDSMGTPGFIPPEIFYHQLSHTSDLYAVGATLICLLTGTPTAEIHRLIYPDEPYRFQFKDCLHRLIPHLNLRFIHWLERMVKPNYHDRMPNARTALEALQPIEIIAHPQTTLSCSRIDFVQVSTFGGPIYYPITIRNTALDTVLQGRCYVMALFYDNVDWITIDQPEFVGNEITLGLTINPQRLKPNSHYRRELVIESNGKNTSVILPISIHTLALSIGQLSMPWRRLMNLFSLGFGVSMLLSVLIVLST